MKKLLCAVLAAGCVFLAACGASSGTTANDCTVTAIREGKTVILSEENLSKLIKAAEKEVDSELMLNLALTVEQAEECNDKENGAYVFIEYPEEIILDGDSEYPVKVKSMEILIGTDEGALILIPDGGIFYAGGNSGSFARKIKSYLK